MLRYIDTCITSKHIISYTFLRHKDVFYIHDATYKSGSVDPYLWIMDPYPGLALFFRGFTYRRYIYTNIKNNYLSWNHRTVDGRIRIRTNNYGSCSLKKLSGDKDHKLLKNDEFRMRVLKKACVFQNYVKGSKVRCSRDRNLTASWPGAVACYVRCGGRAKRTAKLHIWAWVRFF